jgi:hypothetical protein
LEVVYDGEPKFEKIEDTEVAYAINAGSQVLKIKGKYYACEQAVWYVSDSPKGPWQVSDTRPEEVDTIPPSSPAYNNKYVYVYDSTPEVVYVGYMLIAKAMSISTPRTGGKNATKADGHRRTRRAAKPKIARPLPVLMTAHRRHPAMDRWSVIIRRGNGAMRAREVMEVMAEGAEE